LALDGFEVARLRVRSIRRRHTGQAFEIPV